MLRASFYGNWEMRAGARHGGMIQALKLPRKESTRHVDVDGWREGTHDIIYRYIDVPKVSGDLH